MLHFTVTAKILARSLASFRSSISGQTHEFMPCVNERARASAVTNNLTILRSVFHASVLLLTMNFVMTLSK